MKLCLGLSLLLPASAGRAESFSIACQSIVDTYPIIHEWKYRGANGMLSAIEYMISTRECVVFDFSDYEDFTIEAFISSNLIKSLSPKQEIGVILIELEAKRTLIDTYAISTATP